MMRLTFTIAIGLLTGHGSRPRLGAGAGADAAGQRPVRKEPGSAARRPRGLGGRRRAPHAAAHRGARVGDDRHRHRHRDLRLADARRRAEERARVPRHLRPQLQLPRRPRVRPAHRLQQPRPGDDRRAEAERQHLRQRLHRHRLSARPERRRSRGGDPRSGLGALRHQRLPGRRQRDHQAWQRRRRAAGRLRRGELRHLERARVARLVRRSGPRRVRVGGAVRQPRPARAVLPRVRRRAGRRHRLRPGRRQEQQAVRVGARRRAAGPHRVRGAGKARPHGVVADHLRRPAVLHARHARLGQRVVRARGGPHDGSGPRLRAITTATTATTLATSSRSTAPSPTRWARSSRHAGMSAGTR